jgi:YebC/PmpR family DNA-binding regulatory protein
MGRIFEKRKHKMFARWDKMGKAFTRIGKEIAIAVKAGGGDPDINARLRTIIKNAKALNMPKDRVEGAIKRALSKDTAHYEEIVYEAKAPHSICVYIETATDNPYRTVANLRAILSRAESEMVKQGTLDFLFEHKGVFKIKLEGANIEEVEFDLIDYGCEEFMMDEEEGNIIFYTSFSDFGKMIKALEDKNINVISAEQQRIANNYIDLEELQAEQILLLIDKLEQDEDVQNVYHNMK